jgi:hypothetical protein
MASKYMDYAACEGIRDMMKIQDRVREAINLMAAGAVAAGNEAVVTEFREMTTALETIREEVLKHVDALDPRKRREAK